MVLTLLLLLWCWWCLPVVAGAGAPGDQARPHAAGGGPELHPQECQAHPQRHQPRGGCHTPSVLLNQACCVAHSPFRHFTEKVLQSPGHQSRCGHPMPRSLLRQTCRIFHAPLNRTLHLEDGPTSLAWARDYSSQRAVNSMLCPLPPPGCLCFAECVHDVERRLEVCRIWVLNNGRGRPGPRRAALHVSCEQNFSRSTNSSQHSFNSLHCMQTIGGILTTGALPQGWPLHGLPV